ncbi:MAG: hypothetical protein AAB289_08330, partial [Chloroflexota bacterium]
MVNSSIGGVTLSADGATLVNHGSITSGSANVGVTLTGANSTVTNTGAITSAGSTGIRVAGPSTLDNLGGRIRGEGSYGIAFDIIGSAGTATNSGTVFGRAVGVMGPSSVLTLTNQAGGAIEGGATGLLLKAGTITNSGTITGGTTGALFRNSEGESLTIDNRSGGVIMGTLEHGIILDNVGRSTVTNQGTISGGVRGLLMMGTSQLATVTNSGTISGGAAGLSLTSGAVTNTGTITSQTGIAVDITGSTASQLTNSGTITPASGSAAIRMGSGNDTVTLQTGSAVNGNVDGGAGTDTLNVQAGVTFSHSYLNFEALNIEAGQSGPSSSGEPAAPVELPDIPGVTAVTVSSGSLDLSGGTVNSDVTVGIS